MRLVKDPRGEYSLLTAAAAVVARQFSVGLESLRRWLIPAQIDGGQDTGASTEEPAEIEALKT